LFDIENDPMESTNLIDEASLAGVAEEMRQKVRAFRIETKDPWCLASYHEGEPGMEPVVY
jgi:N-sulfoglucosamine sulfohydrolase